MAHKRRLPVLEGARAALASAELPPRLMLAPDLTVEAIAGARVRVSSYSEYDPLVVAADTMTALEAFREPAAPDDVLARTPCLDRELLTRLKRWRVLIAPPVDA
jgi:hypothetical protein